MQFCEHCERRNLSVLIKEKYKGKGRESHKKWVKKRYREVFRK